MDYAKELENLAKCTTLYQSCSGIAMSSSFSSALSSLYPREADQLATILANESVPFGRPENIDAFPRALAASVPLQHAITSFVETSRQTPGGPVSLNAMLHLVLTTVGGEGAAALGPEADEATALISSFLMEHGH